MLAFDPFLSGSFLWNGKMNIYTGQSPWIGGERTIAAFAEQFAPRLNAILISHAHMDHFDPQTINALLQINSEIQIFAPNPVVEWLKASSLLEPTITKYLSPITWEGVYEVEGDHSTLEIHVMPNSKITKEPLPYRVGYLITDSEKKGLFLVGDSHVGDCWDSKRDLVTHLFTWGKAIKSGIIDFFSLSSRLQHAWVIHWEGFTPGNFDCNQDPNEFINIANKRGIGASTLPHNEWVDLK
jgi:hypothetical protein